MKFSKILEKLSPPDFLDVPYFSVIFSDVSVRGLVFDKKDKKPISHKEAILEAGIIESGKIKNPEKLKAALQELSRSASTPFVRFAVPDEVAYVFTADIPVFPGKSAEEGVAFVLEENVPIPLSDAVFDFMPKRVEKTPAGFSATMVATAASSSLVNSYVEVLQSASLEPILCVNESQAIARAVIPKNWKKNSIISYIHTNSVGTYVADGQIVEFSSIAAIPENSNFIQVVVSELSNAVKYCSEHSNIKNEGENKEPIQCFMCGRYEMCTEAMEEINQMGKLNVSLADVWVNAFDLNKYVPDLSFENSLRFASAVGLLI